MRSDRMMYRRRLPHWRQNQATYFVTWRLGKDQAPLAPDERTLVAQTLRHFHQSRYCLYVFVVMDNHVHALVSPEPCQELEQIVHSWKSFTANRMQRCCGRANRIWQDEYFDRIVRDQKEFEEKALYIQGNPFKRWPDIEEYPWVWVLGSDPEDA